MQHAKWNALKEKVPYRVLLHDEGSPTPDLVELQKQGSVTYFTLPRGTYRLPKDVHILNQAPSDSMDAITVDSRGECPTGKVFVKGKHEHQEIISVRRSCQTSLP